MRGEHITKRVRIGYIGGSSPHARGAPRLVGDKTLAEGVIPACAGSTGGAVGV